MLKNNITGIYAIRNKVNNKLYIGQSSSITERWKTHKYMLKNDKHHNIRMQQDFNDNGIENFEFFTVELCSKEKFDERESYWIGHYKSNFPEYGYNKDSGGSKNKKVNIEVRKSLSESAKKRGMPREVIEKAAEANRKRRGELHPFFGKKHSIESRKKMSMSVKGKRIGYVHSEETKRKISEGQLGKKRGPMSEERKKLQSINSGVRITISDEMKLDVINGISRRKFSNKYGFISPWNRIKKAIEGGTIDELF
jgi:group I intron endonuclease